MGGIRSKVENQQVLLVGLEKSGKSLFLKKLFDMHKKENKKESADKNIEANEDSELTTTVGFNHVVFNWSDVSLDFWDLGGDAISRSYWPTFYRNLQFTTVIFCINISDDKSHSTALKELLALVNAEELKTARFFIIFNMKMDEKMKLSYINDPLGDKLYREKAEKLMNELRECPIHEYESRVIWDIIDISIVKRGEQKTTELLSKCLLGRSENLNV